MTDLIRNRVSPEGRELGHKIAQWCDDAEPKARLRMPELPPRCNSCACREGPHLANGSTGTQMDFLKCIMEGHEFYCHEPARENQLCSGWAMFMLAKDDASFAKVPWDFVGADRPLPSALAGTHNNSTELPLAHGKTRSENAGAP